MKLQVNDQQIQVTDFPLTLVSGSVNIYQAEFTFDDSWSGYTKTAVFKVGDNSYNSVITGDACVIPSQALNSTGTLEIGVFGTQGTGTAYKRKPTVWTGKLALDNGVTAGVTPADPTPTIYEQLVALCNTAVTTANTAKTEAEAVSVKMNGETKTQVSSVIDIGTVITEHQSLSAYRTSSAQDVIDATKVGDAPTDSKKYARKNNAWVEIGDGGTATWGNISGDMSNQTDLAEALSNRPTDAPSDNKEYARKNGAWVEAKGMTDYTELSNKPKINNVELNGNKSAAELGIIIPTKTSDLTNDGEGGNPFLTAHQSLSAYRTSQAQDTIDATLLPKSSVTDSVISTSATDALSANQGKLLNDRINNLESIGRYLALWDCATGLPTTNPTALPYTYKAGDYYRVSAIADVNYKPNGSQYTGAASTVIESGGVLR